MSDLAINMVYLPMAIFTLGLIVDTVLRGRHRRRTGNILFILLSLLCWQVVVICYHFSSDFELSRFLYDFKLPFVGWLALAVLLFVIRFFSMDYYHTPVTIACLCVVPAITTLLALISFRHDFLRESIQILAVWPRHTAQTVRGAWYWVHAAVCYVEILTAFGIALGMFGKTPRIYRGPCRVLMLGLAPSVLGNVMVLTGTLDVGLDYSLVGAGLCAIFLYYTTANNKGMDFLNMARNEIMGELDEGIFLLDDEGQVGARNLAARYILYHKGLNQAESSYGAIKETIFEDARRDVKAEEAGIGTHYILEEDGETQVYNVREREIPDKKGRTIGRVAIYTDVTEGYGAIRRLEEESGLDAMTGLTGRSAMEEQLRELDGQGELPLAVIMGDLNNLKEVNDRLGHQQGDALLREAAEALISRSPPRASLARMGGDEFLIVVPGCTLEQAGGLMEEIRQYLSKKPRGKSFRVSIALGAAVKEERDYPLADAIRLADARMYEDKRRSKQGKRG